MTSKCGKNRAGVSLRGVFSTDNFFVQFDVFRDVLLNRPTATWNLVVLYNEQKSKKYILASYRLTVRGLLPAWALTLLLIELPVRATANA